MIDSSSVRSASYAGRADAHLLDVQLAPEACGCSRQRAVDLDRVALVQVGDRTGERDLLAVVGQRREHREAAVLRTPAHRDDLGGEGLGFRHPTRVRCGADRPGGQTSDMGFMDKAKKFAEQAQKQAKDGTLKERAKAIADQAQAKLDEVQTQFNEGQQKGPAPAADTAAPATPATPGETPPPIRPPPRRPPRRPPRPWPRPPASAPPRRRPRPPPRRRRPPARRPRSTAATRRRPAMSSGDPLAG